MNGFDGQSRYTVDHKGRVNIPAKFRKCLSPESQDTLVITRGFEKCLYVYPLDIWNKVTKSVENLPLKLDKRHLVTRRWGFSANRVPFDKQGRIALPPELMRFAEIKDEVIIGGALDRLEIWNPELLEKHFAESEETYKDIYENIMLGPPKSSASE